MAADHNVSRERQNEAAFPFHSCVHKITLDFFPCHCNISYGYKIICGSHFSRSVPTFKQELALSYQCAVQLKGE